MRQLVGFNWSTASLPESGLAAWMNASKAGLLYALALLSPMTAGAAEVDFSWTYLSYQRQQFDRAFEDFTELAARGDRFGQYYLGLMYQLGQGVPRDDALAASWFHQSAEQGYAPAQNKLGELYALGHGVSKDFNQARTWYLAAARQGLADAQDHLGDHPDWRARDGRFFWRRKAAAQGNPIHQFRLAQDYWDATQGKVTESQRPRLLRKSVYWQRKAAERGLAEAQTSMGVSYLMGWGVRRNRGRAIAWFRLAAAQGEPTAASKMGSLYEHGLEAKKDLVEAISWYCKAQDLSRLANLAAGRPCLLELANKGNKIAQWKVGLLYLIGETDGLPEELDSAVAAARWYRKSAEQADAGALNDLSKLYFKGSGVPRDPVIGWMLYELATRHGLVDYVGGRPSLSAEEKREVDGLAAAWKKGTPLPERSRASQEAQGMDTDKP